MTDTTQISNEHMEWTEQEVANQIRLAANSARLRAELTSVEPAAALTGVPDLPPIPDLFKSARILGRFAEEGVKRAASFGVFSRAIARLTGTPEGRRLLDRLRRAIIEGQADPKLAEDLLKQLGDAVLDGHHTLQVALVTDVNVGAGGGGVTGLAIPLTPGSKLKWFSGVEVSGGLIVEVGASLLLGMKTHPPTDLTGGFYGGHAGIHVGAGLGLNVYFDTSDALDYEGFSYTVGIGAGGGVSIIRGWELVTSD